MHPVRREISDHERPGACQDPFRGKAEVRPWTDGVVTGGACWKRWTSPHLHRASRAWGTEHLSRQYGTTSGSSPPAALGDD